MPGFIAVHKKENDGGSQTERQAVHNEKELSPRNPFQSEKGTPETGIPPLL
ncbi:hypothetical protein IMZ17_04160 [Geobacillus stearothermophilus]|jgi:hypothetical protein|nr:hypothetical protein IMZ17_04160 [Geobacillus stearothermophilus]